MKVAVKPWLAVLGLAAALCACEATDIPLAKSTTARNPELAEVPDKDENVRGGNDPAIVTLDLSDALHEHRLTVADELPGNILIPTTNLNAVPVTAALQAVLSGTDVSLSWKTGNLGNRLVTVMNLSGPLPRVVEKICAAAKVFCDYRHGSIELSERETFVVALPPVVRAISGVTSSGSNATGSASVAAAGTSNSMIETMNNLVGSDSKVQVDDQGGNIVYTTNVDGEDRISQYLAQLRTGRPLVVLQMYIWEVTLNRENSQGIDFSNLTFKTGVASVPTATVTNQLATAAATAGSVSLGAVTSGIISAAAVVSFLSTKGQVQTISNPQLTFVSGTNAELRVGGTQRYISQVGSLTNTTNVAGTGTSSNANTGITNNTVSTDSIDTGLTIDVAGAYENGIVFANLVIALKNLVSLNPTASGGGTIDLPQTTDERMSTVLRVRPGDSLVLAGLVTSNDTNTSQGLPVGGEDNAIPLFGDAQRVNHELVMVVKPSIVLFSDQKAKDEAQRRETAKPLPDATVIDREGTRSLAIPQPPLAAPAVPVSSASPSSPDIQASVPVAPPSVPTQVATAAPIALKPDAPADTQGTSTRDIAISPGADDAPVDKRLMQRGFSRAFDQLLQPQGRGTGTLASAGDR